MARFQYRCDPEHGGCGNVIDAMQVDRRLRGTKEMVRILVPPMCECTGPDSPREMAREEFTPARREVSGR